MAKKKISTLSDKLMKVNESFTIYMYDNGFMIEVGGRDSEDEWKTAKVLVGDEDALIALVREAVNMERQD